MRALRVVGLTEDGEVVLEDPVRLERYRVPADERLRAAARGDLSRLGQIAIELESQLRPREIQARIRAGASVEQVAAAAGVPEQKIERFAYPVLLERFRTAENAQRAHPVRADGPDNRTLAEVVAHTFGLRGQEYEGARWDSWKGEDGRWVVALSWRAGRSDNRAHWTFQPGAHGGTVTALDEHASDLVEGLPARPLRTVGAVVDMTRPEEEPPPAPSPVEQWRAAASDSYRERLPHLPDASRGGERGGTRTAPEPWRPAVRREPAVPEQARPDQMRSDQTRPEPARPAAEYAAPTRPADHAAPVRPEPTRPEQVRPEPVRPEQVRPERLAPGRALPEQVRPEPVRPEPTEPEIVQPVAPEAVEPAAAPEPATPEPETVAQPVTPEPAVVEPAVVEPAVVEPAVVEPAVVEPAAVEPEQDVTLEPEPVEPAPAAALSEPAAAEAAAAEAAAPEAAAPGTPPAEAPPVDAPPADAPAAGRRTKKGKPVMPSWDEVLLGVRGPR